MSEEEHCPFCEKPLEERDHNWSWGFICGFAACLILGIIGVNL